MTWNDEAEPCFYCGLAADSIDHVVPQSIITAARDSGDDALIDAIWKRHRRMTVPACRECNSLAGWIFDLTLDDRRRRVKSRLRKRYRRLLEMPDWGDHELVEMSDRFQRLIIAREWEKERLQRRLAW